MFDNIGKKIKMVAKIICGIGIALSVIIAMIMFATAMDSYEPASNMLLGIVILGLGTALSWGGSLSLYGLGELIDKVCDIERNTRSGEIKPEAETEADSERIDKIEKLRSEGLITEEEYQQALAKENN